MRRKSMGVTLIYSHSMRSWIPSSIYEACLKLVCGSFVSYIGPLWDSKVRL